MLEARNGARENVQSERRGGGSGGRDDRVTQREVCTESVMVHTHDGPCDADKVKHFGKVGRGHSKVGTIEGMNDHPNRSSRFSMRVVG